MEELQSFAILGETLIYESELSFFAQNTNVLAIEHLLNPVARLYSAPSIAVIALCPSAVLFFNFFGRFWFRSHNFVREIMNFDFISKRRLFHPPGELFKVQTNRVLRAEAVFGLRQSLQPVLCPEVNSLRYVESQVKT